MEDGEGVVEIWGWRVGVGKEGEDFVGAASLAVEAWHVYQFYVFSTVQSEKKGKRYHLY